MQPLIFKCELHNYPDKAFVAQLLQDIRQGCSIGYSGPQYTHTACNLQSTFKHPTILDEALNKECSNSRILGPFDSLPLPNFRCSGLGIVPKHDGSWHTIYHLSAPSGRSVNNFIDSIDEANSMVNNLGPGKLLSKIDLKINAFHFIPVRQQDWNLLGICW